MRTLWLLRELELPFELRTYPFDETLQRPEFLALSPIGRVPALEIEGEVMFETGAITEYLCERFSPDVLGRSPGSLERMEWLTWVHFAETLSAHVANLTQQHIMLFDDSMRSPVLMKLEAKRLDKCYAAVEAKLTKGFTERYILEGGFSAVDIGLGQAIYMGRHFATLDDYPALSDWYGRMSERPAFRAALPEPGQVLYDRSFYDWRDWQ
jgi:glutathione S-transferase